MKNTVKTLVLALAVSVSITSCSNEEEANPTPEVTINNIVGNYSYNVVLVANAVDLDEDGNTNTNLMKEAGKECVWDNNWVFTKTDVTLFEKEIKCDTDSPEILLKGKYSLNTDEKIITITGDNDEVLEILNDVLIEYDDFSGITYLSFSQYDSDLKQSIRYVLKK